MDKTLRDIYCQFLSYFDTVISHILVLSFVSSLCDLRMGIFCQYSGFFTHAIAKFFFSLPRTNSSEFNRSDRRIIGRGRK